MRKGTTFAAITVALGFVVMAISGAALTAAATADSEVTVTSSAPDEAAVTELFRRLANGKGPRKGDAETVRFVLDSTEGLAKSKRCGFSSTDVRFSKDAEWYEADMWGKTRYGNASEKRAAGLKYSRHLGFCYLTTAKGFAVTDSRSALAGATQRAGYALAKMTGSVVELRKGAKVIATYRWSPKWDR